MKAVTREFRDGDGKGLEVVARRPEARTKLTGFVKRMGKTWIDVEWHSGDDVWVKRAPKDRMLVVVMWEVTLPDRDERAREAWERLQLQRAVLSGHEIAMLKALGWKPVGEGALSGQEVIDAGERAQWTRGVLGEEPLDQSEALALAERWWIDEQNARGWKSAKAGA